MKSKFNYEIVYEYKKPTIFIEDLMGVVSVTNDIENVLEYIAEKENIDIKYYNIIYKDSYGKWDAVEFSNKGIIAFIILDSSSKEDALNKLK